MLLGSFDFVTPAGLDIPTAGASQPVKKEASRPKASFLGDASLFCDSRGIQTHNLLIRSQMLYSIELGSHHFLQMRCKGTAFSDTGKIFATFFSKKSSMPQKFLYTFIIYKQQ